MLDKPFIWEYSAHKASLEKASEQLSNLKNTCKVTLIKFGYVGTERVLTNIKPLSYISLDDALQVIKTTIEISSKYRCNSINVIPE